MSQAAAPRVHAQGHPCAIPFVFPSKPLFYFGLEICDNVIDLIYIKKKIGQVAN